MMRSLYLRDLRDDRGSIILALLGIIILTTVASVGLAAVVNGQHQSRHDNTFTQALNNAESGIDAMVANIKSSPNCNSPSKATLPTSGCTSLSPTSAYTVTATAVNNIGSTGAAADTTWTITSIGTSTVQGEEITRTVTENVTIVHTYNAPLEGKNGLTLSGSGNSVNNCSSCVGANPTNVTSQVISTGLTIAGLTLGSTTITNVPNSTTPGGAETGGPLVMQSNDLSGFGEVALDGSGASCASSTAVCTSSTIAQQSSPPPAITTPGCTPGALGATVNGVGISLPDPLGVVLNTSLGLQLNQQPPITDTMCTNLPIVIPTVGASIAGLTTIPGLSAFGGLTTLNTSLDAPIGADCLTNGLQSLLTTLLSGANLTCTMDPPQDLVINEMGGSTVYLGTGGTVPTYVSALINNPGGNCTITGNVVLYGSINCATITVSAGSTLTVDYPTDQGLTEGDTQHADSVDQWNETQ
jgi:hypothetical protein